MLEGWHEFYVLLGTAAAALVALLFVAASIGAGFLGPERAGAIRTFMSPVVVHYTCVLFLSLVALAPHHTHASVGLIVAAVAIMGLAYSTFILVRVHRDDISDLADRLAYGAGPVAAYAAALAAAGFFLAHSDDSALVLGGALVLLLLVNIRNAWDLMLTMVRKHTDQQG